jgi:hypothetical protein
VHDEGGAVVAGEESVGTGMAGAGEEDEGPVVDAGAEEAQAVVGSFGCSCRGLKPVFGWFLHERWGVRGEHYLPVWRSKRISNA